MMTVWLLARGILLGLAAAAPIGPVNIEIARRTFRHGFAAGVFTGMGAVSVDVLYLTLSGIGVRLLVQQTAAYRAIGLAGAALLAYLGTMSLRAAIGGFRGGEAAAPQRWGEPSPPAPWRSASAPNAYLTGFLMTLLNPMTLAFWFIAVPAAVGAIASQPRSELPIMGVGVFLGTALWVVTFAGLLDIAARRSTHRARWLPLADLIGGAMLIAFAALALWNSTRTLI